MRYLIIPPWLSNQQNALRFGNSAYLNLKELESLLSDEDLSTYISLQLENIAERLLGPAITCSHLQSADFKGDLAFLGNECLFNLTTVANALWRNISDDDLIAALFAGLSSNAKLEQISMKPVLISGDTIGIFFEYTPQVLAVDARRTFIESLINVLYAFNPFEVISSQPYFKEYLHITRKGYVPPRAVLDVYCNRM